VPIGPEDSLRMRWLSGQAAGLGNPLGRGPTVRSMTAISPYDEPRGLSANNRGERAGPSWGRETAVNNGQSRRLADNQTGSWSAVIGPDGAAGPYMACKGSGVQIPLGSTTTTPQATGLPFSSAALPALVGLPDSCHPRATRC
jgi:hypothetical protein